HMSVLDAPDIRWSTLAAEMDEAPDGQSLPQGEHGEAMAGYDLAAFRLAVVDGQHPDGTDLSRNMPRWDLDEEDLADVAEFLRSLP
ncbi:MAG: c-type cytochrome, partial [Anaerolineales bacterium]|nr:c-type cytochrome [Anaerolineales bacterium]